MNIWKRQVAKANPLVIASFGDTHPNSTLGLCPPRGIALDDGGYYKPNKIQLEFWDYWLEYWDVVKTTAEGYGADVYSIFGGDGTDDNKYSKHQLISVNESTMIKISEKVLTPALELSKRFFYIRGTEAHAGGAGELEEMVAERIGAVPDPDTGNHSWWELPFEKHGICGFFTHHPYSNSLRPWTAGAAANRTATIIKYDYADDPQQRPDFAVFHHVHHLEDSGLTHGVRVFYNYPWKATAAHGHRIGFTGRVVPIGGFIFIFMPTGDWFVKVFEKRPKRKRRWIDT